MFYSNWRFRLVLFSLIMLVITGYFSYVEMIYLLQSRSVRATVTRLSEMTERRRSSTLVYLQVEYAFAELTGTRQTGSGNQPLGWRPPADGTILMQYTPGEYGRSRIAGKVNVVVLVLFGCSFAVLTVFGSLLWLEARAATRPRNPVRTRRRQDRGDG